MKRCSESTVYDIIIYPNSSCEDTKSTSDGCVNADSYLRMFMNGKLGQRHDHADCESFFREILFKLHDLDTRLREQEANSTSYYLRLFYSKICAFFRSVVCYLSRVRVESLSSIHAKRKCSHCHCVNKHDHRHYV